MENCSKSLRISFTVTQVIVKDTKPKVTGIQ